MPGVVPISTGLFEGFPIVRCIKLKDAPDRIPGGLLQVKPWRNSVFLHDG
jgi:hypothetical protein